MLQQVDKCKQHKQNPGGIAKNIQIMYICLHIMNICLTI